MIKSWQRGKRPARLFGVARHTVACHRLMPGFLPTVGLVWIWLGGIVLVPLFGIFLKASTLGWAGFWRICGDDRVLAALRLSLTTALIAACINALIGSIIAWVFVRYSFFGKRFFDLLIDLPFALPTAVGGIALTSLYAPTGWIGRWLTMVGITVVYRPLGIVLALVFVGLPFVVRVVQPVLEDLDRDLEHVAATLGASRWQTLWHVILPTIRPAILTGFMMAFSRGVGEYGSVIFIAGNIPRFTEITPLLIAIRLEEFDYVGATAIAATLLLIALSLLLVMNGFQAIWARRLA